MNEPDFTIKKVLKTHKGMQLVQTNEVIYGGQYAVITFSKATTGLCLDAANDLFYILKKLTDEQ